MPLVAERPPILVLIGVAGSGKSTIAAALAAQLGWDVGEGDDLHPPENIAKMAAGKPLTDADRVPWLRRVRAWIEERIAAGRPAIITCSALKRAYRDVLRDPHVVFVHLAASHDVLAARLAARHGHFMPAALLDSQLAVLEPPDADEQVITIDVATSPADQVGRIVAELAAGRA